MYDTGLALRRPSQSKDGPCLVGYRQISQYINSTIYNSDDHYQSPTSQDVTRHSLGFDVGGHTEEAGVEGKVMKLD